MSDDVRASVATACRILARAGQDHFYLGHVSARVPDGSGTFYMKASGIGLGQVTDDDVLVLSPDGQRLGGSTAPIHHEVFIHAAIYAARADVMGVVHTHPLRTAAFAATDAPLRMVSQDSVLFAAGFGRYDDARLVTDAESGRRLAAALGAHDLVVMRNHGLAAAGPSIEAATFLALSFERSLAVQEMAGRLGEIVEIEPSVRDEMGAYFRESYAGRAAIAFRALAREVD